MLLWDKYEVNLPQYVNAVVQFFPGSAIASQFPTFWGIGNPTDFQVSWGTWLGVVTLTKYYGMMIPHDGDGLCCVADFENLWAFPVSLL